MRADTLLLTVKRPPPHTSDSNHLHNQANRARKSWRSDVPIILPGWASHGWVPVNTPQYTRADFGPEAVGSTNPNVKPHGRVKSRMVAEPQIHGRNHAPVPRQLDDVDL